MGGYDWIAIPVVPYLYAVDDVDQVPASATPDEAASLRDSYRRLHLKEIVPDGEDSSTPSGDWTQLVGEAYDRSMYAFGIETTEKQDDGLIRSLNARPNRTRFHLLSQNCADFTRQVINFYFPKAVHRNFGADLGIMTPKQAAKSLMKYDKKHSDIELSTLVIAQVPGTIARSSAVRGVLESLVKSKRYAVPLASLAVLHPIIGGGLAYAWMEGSQFNPRNVTAFNGDVPLDPAEVVSELRSNSFY